MYSKYPALFLHFNTVLLTGRGGEEALGSFSKKRGGKRVI
jgi:hypothetical protein